MTNTRSHARALVRVGSPTETKPADLIKERSDGAFVSQLAESLTLVRPLNKNDVATLHANFGSLASIMHASHEQLAACPGLGERKVRRLCDAFAEPFVPRSARGQPQQDVAQAAAGATAACTAAAPPTAAGPTSAAGAASGHAVADASDAVEAL